MLLRLRYVARGYSFGHFIELRGTRREDSIAIACESCWRAEPGGQSKRADASHDHRFFRPKVAAAHFRNIAGRTRLLFVVVPQFEIPAISVVETVRNRQSPRACTASANLTRSHSLQQRWINREAAR